MSAAFFPVLFAVLCACVGSLSLAAGVGRFFRREEIGQGLINCALAAIVCYVGILALVRAVP